MREDLMTITAGTQLGSYKILALLGAGGMGEVYLAEDTRLRRKVALKVLPDSLAQDKERLRRFEQEAFAASALNHPNILTIYEFGVEGATHFLATEFIDGETLRARLERAPLSLTEALEIAAQTAQALAAAHAAKIIHRDIKPENVMLRKDGIVKVLDFGLAKLVEPAPLDAEAETRKLGLTQAGTVMGTVAYMSPEQARGQTVDARTDIFSLGVMLYEMLARRQPFTGETINHVIVAILEKEPPPLQQEVPAELARILKQMLAKSVDERYASAQAMLADLKKLQKRLEYEAEYQGDSSSEAAPEARTMILNQATAAAPEALATAAGSAQPTTPNKTKAHKWWLAGVLSLLVLVGGYFGYRYFTSSKQIESIAVMPFVNASGNGDVEYLSDGMTETLIKSLSNLPNLNVKPRSSVFRYKGKDTNLQTIAKELNVQAILNGRVTQRGEQLTLSLELVDVRKDSVIWTEQYQRKTSDLVALQSEIARDVLTHLKAKLSRAEETKVTRSATSDPEAYQAYLKGRYYWNRRTSENLKKAIAQFKTATDRDPNYALAFAGLADCYVLLNEYSGVPTTEAAPQAKAYAERAIAIDESLAEPHATLGNINRQLWQWTEAEREFKRALELNPNYATAYHWYSITLVCLGRKDESLAMIQRARELDPMSSIIAATFSWVQLLRNNHQASIDTLLKLIELDPSFGIAYENLGLSYLKTGRNAEAVAALEKSAQLTDRYGVVLGNLGYVYAVTGKRTEALAIIKELEEKYTRKEASGLSIASVYAGLGDKDKAFEWLEKDFQNRDGHLPDITVSIPLESLRDDARFKEMLRRMNLPE